MKHQFTDSVQPAAIVIGLTDMGLSLARDLGRRGVRVIGFYRSKKEPGVHSRYLAQRIEYGSSETDLLPKLLELGKSASTAGVLFATNDRDVAMFSEHQDELRRYFKLPMPDREHVHLLLDKLAFNDYAHKEGLIIPASFEVGSLEELQSMATKVAFPAIIKPAVKSTAFVAGAPQKAFMADNGSELIDAYKTIAPFEKRCIVQEWIPGGTDHILYCLQYYDRNSRALVSFCGRKIRDWPPKCGSFCSTEPVVDELADRLTQASSQLFRRLHFTGLGSVEFKLDDRDGQLKIIEPTVGRVNAQFRIAVANGVDLAWIAYQDLIGKSPDPVPQGDGKVKHIDEIKELFSFQEAYRAGELTFREWCSSLRGPRSYVYFASDDLRPAAAAVAKFFRQVSTPIWRRLLRLLPGRRSE